MLQKMVCILIFAFGAAVQAAAQTDFPTTVKSSHPVAYFRLDATLGNSAVGSATYQSKGGATTSSGSPTGAGGYVNLDGQSGAIVTTQAGGVVSGASIMAWVDLAELPSKTGRLVYVAGESEYGNDLDLQFDTDDGIKFWTAAGGHVSYTPPPATLVNHWHMILVTLDIPSKTRAIYWDGKLAATDKGGASGPKKSVFTIGASPVFTGRNLKGGIAEVALWTRALKQAEVEGIYAAAGAAGGSAGGTGAAASAPAAATATSGPFATTAKVQADDAKGAIQLKREEQIALMFMSAMEQIEHDCQLNQQHACSMNEALAGGPGHEHLKFDPNKTDPNYSYTLVSAGMAWEAHANAKKPGLKGFCFMARSIGTTVTTYSPSGKAGWVDIEIMGRGIDGDSFETQ